MKTISILIIKDKALKKIAKSKETNRKLNIAKKQNSRIDNIIGNSILDNNDEIN